jgi:hypothetical protein
MHPNQMRQPMMGAPQQQFVGNQMPGVPMGQMMNPQQQQNRQMYQVS